MAMICFGFLDTCIPLGLVDKNQDHQNHEPLHAMKSQHDLYWDERCDASPSAPGCRIYDE